MTNYAQPRLRMSGFAWASPCWYCIWPHFSRTKWGMRRENPTLGYECHWQYIKGTIYAPCLPVWHPPLHHAQRSISYTRNIEIKTQRTFYRYSIWSSIKALGNFVYWLCYDKQFLGNAWFPGLDSFNRAHASSISATARAPGITQPVALWLPGPDSCLVGNYANSQWVWVLAIMHTGMLPAMNVNENSW